MNKFLLVLSLFAFSFSALAVDEVELCNLSAPIQSIEADPARQVALIKAYFADKQVVGVTGFLGCTAGTFKDAQATLKTLDPSIPMQIICPSDSDSVETNVNFLVNQLTSIAARNPKRRIVLLGQSKGAAEILQLLATHPQYLEAGQSFEVANAMTFSAAIGGSAMADLALETDPVLMDKWYKYKEAHGIKDSWFGQILKWILLDPSKPGLQSLATPVSRARNEKLEDETPRDVRRMLEDKVFFVTATRESGAKDVPSFLTNIAQFMAEQDEPNDGLVYEKDQKLRGFGTHLMRVNKASHFSMVSAQGRPECRKEMARLFFLKLAVSGN